MPETAQRKSSKRIAGLLREMMMRMGRATDGGLLRLVQRVELTLPQIISLEKMRRGPQTVSGLASDLRLTQGAVSRLVDLLVEKRLVHRAESESDRRIKVLCLTDTGRRTIAQFDAVRAEGAEKLLSGLDPALAREFERVLERVLVAVRGPQIKESRREPDEE
jgi:DNA-binding MarR family transcriptional regulator